MPTVGDERLFRPRKLAAPRHLVLPTVGTLVCIRRQRFQCFQTLALSELDPDTVEDQWTCSVMTIDCSERANVD